MVNVQKPRARGEPGVFTGDPVPRARPAEPRTVGRGGKRVSTAGTEPPQETHSRSESGSREPAPSGSSRSIHSLADRCGEEPTAETATEAATYSSEGRAVSVFRVIAHNSPTSSPP